MDAFNFISKDDNEKDKDELMCESILQSFADLPEDKQTEFIQKVIDGNVGQGIVFGIDDKTFTLQEIVEKLGIEAARTLLIKVSKSKRIVASKDPEVMEALNALMRGEATEEQKEMLLKKAGYTKDTADFFPDSDSVTALVTTILCGMDISKKEHEGNSKLSELLNAMMIVVTLNAVKHDNGMLSNLGPVECSEKMADPVMEMLKYVYELIDKGCDIHMMIATLIATAVRLSEMGKVEFKLDAISDEFGFDFSKVGNDNDSDDDDECCDPELCKTCTDEECAMSTVNKGKTYEEHKAEKREKMKKLAEEAKAVAEENSKPKEKKDVRSRMMDI